jgi:peroxiredoxin
MEMVHRLTNLSKGRPAPSISGVDSSGAPVNLDQYKGKVVMLVFWSSFDLPVDKTVELLELMRKIEKQYAGKNFVLIGVNKDQIGNLRELEKEDQTSKLNISDPQQRIFKEYRVGNPPHCYVIDQQGRIQFTGIVGSFATLTVDALLNPGKPKQ